MRFYCVPNYLGLNSDFTLIVVISDLLPPVHRFLGDSSELFPSAFLAFFRGCSECTRSFLGEDTVRSRHKKALIKGLGGNRDHQSVFKPMMLKTSFRASAPMAFKSWLRSLGASDKTATFVSRSCRAGSVWACKRRRLICKTS